MFKILDVQSAKHTGYLVQTKRGQDHIWFADAGYGFLPPAIGDYIKISKMGRATLIKVITPEVSNIVPDALESQRERWKR